MIQPSTQLRGIVRGRTIELDSSPGLPDRQEVAVIVEVVVRGQAVATTDAQQRWTEAQAQVEHLAPGEGLRRSFGTWAEDAEELDAYLASNRERRKIGRPGIEP
jgi:hypothetical protein